MSGSQQPSVEWFRRSTFAVLLQSLQERQLLRAASLNVFFRKLCMDAFQDRKTAQARIKNSQHNVSMSLVAANRANTFKW